MFHREHKKSNLVKPLKDLITIESPAILLDTQKRQALLENIGKLSGFDTDLFRKIGTTLIHNLVSYCQNLPETDQYYALPGGLVDRALIRTEAALMLFRNRLVQGEDEPLSEEQKIWLYALFSAALLQGIGKLYTDYRLDVFDSNGKHLKQWQPLLENICQTGKYYQYEFLRGDDHDFRANVTLILAEILMPSAGFEWIIKDSKVFAAWLSLLHEDMLGADALGAILERANAIAIAHDIEEFLHMHINRADNRAGRINTFVDMPPGTSFDKEKLLGAEFINWLMASLSSGKILINKFPLMMVVQGGILMSPELFKMFVDQHGKIKSVDAVQHAFLAWGLHHKGLNGNDFSRVEYGNKGQMLDGIKIDTAILPNEVKLYHANTEKITTCETIDLVKIVKSGQDVQTNITLQNKARDQQLSLNGKWGTEDAANKLFKPGTIKSV